MDRIDYKNVYRECYRATSHPALVEIAPMQFLTFDGRGDPEVAPRFGQGVEALFRLAHAIRFLLKKGPMGLDFTVMPLEALWWTEEAARVHENRAAWQWTLMLMQPPVVSAATVEEARLALRARDEMPPALDDVNFSRFEEGRAVQSLHVGPFAQEGPAVQHLHRFAAEQGYRLHGRHHEIYLSDIRRTPPEKRKTILRHPVVQSV